MKYLILASVIAVGGLCSAAEASTVVRHHHARVERVQPVEYARLECILPWYRFFGACPEAIDDSETGGNSHGSGWPRHHHHHW